MKILKLLCLLLISSFYQAIGQQWINKNENENYVQRHECSFVQSGDRFIMFGGREQAKRLDIYNYTNDTWSQGAQAPLEFNHFQATQYDGLIWVIGAFQTNNFPNEVPADKVYIYNPALNIWLEGPTIPQSRRRGGAGLVVYEDKFYVVAGNKVGHNGGFVPLFDRYDPLMNTWEQLTDAPRARDHFSAAVIGDKLYAASGRLSGGTGGVFAPLIQEVDVYDFTSNSWSTLDAQDNLPTPRAGASVVAFENELFVIGGEGSQAGPAFKKVEAYNPSTNSWSTKENMNFARHGTQAIISGSGIHIAGGSPNRGGGRQHNMEAYNIDSPIGSPIVASTLTALNSVAFQSNESKNIELTSANGNAGNFIIKVELTGADASSFVLQNNLEKHLIKSGTSQTIRILANTNATAKAANLVITYDNNKKVTIALNTGSTPPPPPPTNGTAIPGTIQVENFAAKNGAVRAENTPGTNAGQNLGFIQNNNYTEYDIDVITTGTYTLSTFVSSNGKGGTITTSINGTSLGTLAVAVNNAWHSYNGVTTDINLTQGPQKLRFTYTGPAGFLFNFERAEFTLNSAPPQAADCSVAPTGLVFSSSSETTATFSFDNTANDTRTFELRTFAKGTFDGNLSNAISFAAAAAGTTTITTSNLQAGTEYDFVFRALCEGGTPGDSPLVQVSATTDGNGGTPPATIATTVTLSPIQDAYLQGTTNFNNNILRIESGKRVGYLQYDLSGVNGVITSAELKMTCNADNSTIPMNVKVEKGNSNNWTEANLSNTNKPSADGQLGVLNSPFAIGTTYTWDLDTSTIAGGSNLSLIVSSTTNGLDVAFASKENSAPAPQLVITYDAISGLNKSENNVTTSNKIVVHPNPAQNLISFQGISKKDVIIGVIDMTGRSVISGAQFNQETQSLNVSNLEIGIYTVLFNSDSGKKAIRFSKQ